MDEIGVLAAVMILLLAQRQATIWAVNDRNRQGLVVLQELRTVVTFESSLFNTSESKPYFINEGCFGEDIANWLKNALRAIGCETAETPGQEDFGWYLDFTAGGEKHCFVISFRPDDAIWIGWLERSRLIMRHSGIAHEAIHAIHRALSGEPAIRDVRWHLRRDFDAGHLELGKPSPR